MNALSVLVVDDEPLARRRLFRLLHRLDWIRRIDEAVDVRDAREQLDSAQPDILLLDIQMPGGNGFDLLEGIDQPPVVVFVTAFDHHALQAFEANAIDYLTKPVEPGRFAQAMTRARQAAEQRTQTERIQELQEAIAALKRSVGQQTRRVADLWVKHRGEHLRLAADTITRIQAERDYTRLHVDGADYLYPDNLSTIERRLDPEAFMRVHRSTIVRCESVTRIRGTAFSTLVLVMSDGAEVRVGRTYTTAVRARLMND